MKNSKRIMFVFIVFALATIGVSAQAQPGTDRTKRVTDPQVSSILQRIERSSNRFRGSLNLALVNARIDQTRPQNDINTFEPALQSAIDQFRDRFNRREAWAADVENILQKALLVNGFMTRNRLNARVQNDWATVRTDLKAMANAYGVNWQWNQQPLPPVDSSRSSRLSDGQLNQLIQRIETGGDRFQSSLTDAFNRSRNNQTTNEENMNDAVHDFKNATAQLRNQFDARQPVADYVERVLARAAPIDTFMHNNRLTNQTQTAWATVHRELNMLAGAFNLSANLRDTDEPPPPPRYNSNSRLTGTFRLDPSRSDNPRETADRATRSLPNNQRQGVNDRMLARLESPQMLAIERNNSTITMASSRAQRSTFEADGVERQEQLNGRTSRVTATLRGDELVVKSTGYRENDFNVSFEPIENGRRLRVTREVFTDRLNQPMIVSSIYDRTSDVAQWNIYSGSPVLGNTANNGEFILRDGETVVAVLNNDLTTKQAKQGDRFTLTLREPGQYEGAVIEGTVGTVTKGGTLTGRSGMTLDFDTIRLRNGQSYRFAGTLSSVRTVNGETVKVDNEGSAQGDNQTTQTVTRTGIGTAIGAIIGAVAGGGKGAAIGAAIGAAGGAGSVFVTGKESLELPQGTELTIRAGAPVR
jgi:hypothetical protein